MGAHGFRASLTPSTSSLGRADMGAVFHSLDITTASVGEIIDEITRLIATDPDTATDDDVLDAIADLIDEHREATRAQ